MAWALATNLSSHRRPGSVPLPVNWRNAEAMRKVPARYELLRRKLSIRDHVKAIY
jgi:hypothetical protein